MDNTHRFLNNALKIFEDVATGKEKLSIQSLADRHQLSYASCYRIIHTFTEAGWLEQTKEGVYRSCPELMIKIDPKREQEFLIETLKDAMHELVSRTELAAKLTMRQGHEAFSFFTLTSPRPNSIFTKLSSRFHLVAGSSGACLMSDLSDKEIRKVLKTADDHYWANQNEMDVLKRIQCVRESGYALDQGTTSPHWYAASVPLRWPEGRVAAAVTLLGFPTDFGPAQLSPILRELKKVQNAFAEKLSQDPQAFSDAV